MNLSESKEYKEFLEDLKKRVYAAQYQALKAVNKELIQLYWDIGKSIVEKQVQYGWGKSIVENLAKDLQNEFPGTDGFSNRNLWRMKMFYVEYQQNTIPPPLVAELGWSHNMVIIEKCKYPLEREFYMLMTKRYGWTKNVLIHHIEGKSYERFLMNQTNFDQTVPEKYRNQAKLAVKDEYNFELLEIADEHLEKELESAIVKNMRIFLNEMGGDYAFVGHQYKLQIGKKEFFIDLLLYHRKLKSLIAIELKTGEFIAEYAGKMQLYLTALDKNVKEEDENPSIGIIICKDKDRTLVEYALNSLTSPIGVSKYRVTPNVPKEMEKYLPTPEQLAKNITWLIDAVKAVNKKPDIE